MNPLAGLQNPNPMATWQQGMPQQGLMGNGLQQSQSQMPPSLMNMQPGNWSQVAYQMAGSPKQGGLYPSVTPPSLMPGTGTTYSPNSSSGIGGTALGLLGALAKNPSLLKSAGSAISGLMGGGTAGLGSDAAAAINSSAVAGLEPVGVGAVDELPSVSAAVDAADAGAAGAASSAGGLLGGGVSLAGGAGTTSALGAGAPGVFATGDAAAGSGGAAAGGSLGLAPAAGIAAILPVGLMLGDAWTGKNTQGNAAMKGWMQATGATWKPNYTNSGQNTFGTNNGLMNASSNPGTMYDKSGQVMTPTQAANAIYSWAVANHMNPGDFQPT